MTLIEYKESVTVNGQFIRNHSTVAYSQVTETGTVPASLVMESSERVAPDSVVTATINATSAEVLPWGNAVNAGEVAIDRERGLWRFHASDAGKAISVTYDPAGTVVTAAKMEAIGQGEQGEPGVGVPAGGTPGQVLSKVDGTDYNTEWVDQTGDAVDSVNGQTGVVDLDALDVGAADALRYKITYVGVTSGATGMIADPGDAVFTYNGLGVSYLSIHAADAAGRVFDSNSVKKGSLIVVYTAVGQTMQCLVTATNIIAPVITFTVTKLDTTTLAVNDEIAVQTFMAIALPSGTLRVNQSLIWNGTAWIAGPRVTTSSTEPTSPVGGDIFFDQGNKAVKIWDTALAAWDTVADVGGGGSSTISTSITIPHTSVFTTASAALGNILSPAASMSVARVVVRLNVVSGATYNIGFAPYNTATSQMTAAPTYCDTVTAPIAGSAQCIVGSFNTPVAMTAGSKYVLFLTRTDSTGTVSQDMYYQSTGSVFGCGIEIPAAATALKATTTTPTTSTVWTSGGSGIWSISFVYAI